MSAVAIDLGGTRIKAALVEGDAAGVPATAPTPPGGPAALEAAARVARDLLDGAPCEAAGLCVPGLVDPDGRVASLPGKLDGLEETDLRAFLRDALGAARAVVANDALAYAAGEAAAGAGAGFERVVVMTIGTGVGVAVIQDGLPLTTGRLGAGITGGFIPISERTDGPADSIGRPDTIEAMCAAQRIVDEARAAGAVAATVEEVYAACARGDEAAARGIAGYRAHLVRALVALASAHTPGCIVLGGGPMTSEAPLLPGLEREVNARMFGSYRVAVRVACLGDAASLVGLARMLGTTP